MTPRRYSLSVILPAFNEAANVPVLLERALAIMPNISNDFEVILVDDGSTDATAAAAQPYVDAEHPRVRLVRHVRNLGYGAAIRTGFAHASKDLVFYTDADNQFDLAELEYFVPLIDQHDVVIGFRVYRYDSVMRCIVSWCYNRLVGIL